MKPLSAVDRTVTLSALVLLVFSGCGVSQADVGVLTIKYMTWGDDGGTPTSTPQVTVCSDEELDPDAATFRLTVKISDVSQFAFDGVKLGANCTTFTANALDGPESASTTYEVTVYSESNEELQSGAVTYAFPLVEETLFDCNSFTFGRFTVTDSADVSTNCLESASEFCYVGTDQDDNLCVPDLDSVGSGFTVCVPGGSSISPTADLITGVALTYDDSFRFLFSGSDPVELAVMTDSLQLAAYNAGGISFSTGGPSDNVYELCAVFDDGAGVLSVDTFSFQDLNLVVQKTDTTVDFYFADLGGNADYEYTIYGGASALEPFSGEQTFTLNCNNIVSHTTCNGFFIAPPDLPAFVGVSYDSTSGGNEVITSVPSSLFSRGGRGNATASHHYNSRGAQKTPGSA